MADRLHVRDFRTLTVAGGTGFLDSGPLQRDALYTSPARLLTYLVIEANVGGSSAPTPKGKIRLIDLDQSPDQDIFKDPKPGSPDVLLDFYTFEMRIPLIGTYRLQLDDVNRNGAYKVYPVFEERPRTV